MIDFFTSLTYPFSTKINKNGKSKINFVVDSESIVVDFNKKKVSKYNLISSIVVKYVIFCQLG